MTLPAMKERIRIAVIGTINHDEIIRPDGRRLQDYGGILYNLKVLAGLCADRATIIPVVNIGKDHAKAVASQLSKLPGLSLEAVRYVNRPNNHCLLRYNNDTDKQELLRGWVGAVSRQQLRTILAVDFILLNFISGGDISRSNLLWLRRQTDCPIYIDLHSRTLGRSRDGHRYLRVPPHWKEYLSSADLLQMNETEFRLLSGSVPDRNSCRRFLSLPALAGCLCLLVTLGERGCLLTDRTGTRVTCREIRAPRAARVLDTTGCGDIFAAAFIYRYLTGGELPSAARFACSLATARTACRTPADFGREMARLTPGI